MVRDACTRGDVPIAAAEVPPGLFLPSTVQDYSHWHGDYHTNYNFQEPFWGDYTANHLELGDAYFDGVKFMLPIGRKIARDYYNCRGVFIQLSMFPIPAGRRSAGRGADGPHGLHDRLDDEPVLVALSLHAR